MAEPGAALARDHQILAAADEAEERELLDRGAVEAGLEVPVEGGEGLADAQAALVDPALDRALAPTAGDLHALEERRVRRPLGERVLVEVVAAQVDEPEGSDVSEDSSSEVVVAGVAGRGGALGGACGG